MRLPAEGNTSSQLSLDASLQLDDQIGPLVLTEDGQYRVIANWAEMSDDEKAVTKRRIEKRNAERAEQANANLSEGQAFLEQNAAKDGVETTESGLQYQIVEQGEGDAPAATDTVVVHYTGTLLDGTEFDSSHKRGQPATFKLNGVIKGWTEGLQKIKPGGKAKLFIPPDLAYGERGAGAMIGPNQTLIFDVELIEVKKTEE